MEKLNLKYDLVEKFTKQAEEEYPNECCGFLLGRVENNKVTAEEYLLQENNAVKEKVRRFLINPQDFISVEEYADANGLSIIGIVHSHPDSIDIPSEYDRIHAWPGLSYIIISVRNGIAGSFRSWLLKKDSSGFDQEKILLSSPKHINN